MNAEPKPARWKQYKKGIVAGSGGAIVAGMAALDQTGVLTAYPWASAAVSVITAMGVYQVRNEHPEQATEPAGTYTVPHPYQPPAPTYSPPVLPPPEEPDA